MSRLLAFCLTLAWLVPGTLLAQTRAAFDAAQVQALLPADGILNNSVTNLHAEGDSLWVGPFLNLTTDGGQTWLRAETDSLFGTPNRIFSLDVEGDVVWAGLGFVDQSAGGAGVQTAAGFLVSEDGGQTFSYRFPQLDSADDTTEPYGISTLEALPIIVPQQSPPFDLDYDPATGTVWVAAWASGIRRSDDGGRTWQRVVLPPDDLTAIDPDSLYDFKIEPQRGGMGFLNYMGFGILVDEAGVVWAGTPAGVNRSEDGGLRWRRFSADGTARSLTGNWVISIEEQPLPGRNPIWMATWNAGTANEGTQFGITRTRDGGATFEQMLLGERIFDFAFRGQTIYAAGDRGLFISDDDGATWRTVRDFRDNNQPDRLVRPDVSTFSVATTRDALWVGTGDGLLKSTDEGFTWTLFRVEVPLHPETPTDEVPDVDTFAYPNPFSPAVSRFTRLRYELEQQRNVDIRIFDFGMNLVRRLVDESQAAGIREVTWDGTDDDGLRVANGPYFYAVRTGRETFWGKILVIE